MCYSPVTYLMEITTVKICSFRHKINSNGFFFQTLFQFMFTQFNQYSFVEFCLIFVLKRHKGQY